jgi:hypothetical protein
MIWKNELSGGSARAQEKSAPLLVRHNPVAIVATADPRPALS